MKKIIAIIFLFSILSLDIQAQRGWEVGGWIGASNYFGDLNTRFNVKFGSPAGGLIGRYNFNNRIGVKFGVNYGNLRADDAESKNSFEQRRNLSFNSHIFEGTTQLEFNFFPYDHGSYDNFYTPYVFAGFNVFHFNPRAKYEGDWVKLQPLGTEGQFKGSEYFLTQLGLVYGLGMKWDISDDWSMNFELGARYLFTDYVDDVSDVYPEKDDLESLRGDLAVALSDRSLPDDEGMQIGEAGRFRGDPTTKDTYTMIGIGIVKYFGKVRCYRFN